MKKFHFKTVLFILLCYSVPIIAQDDCNDEGGELFNSSVGINYLFSSDGNETKIKGIGSKFRQYVSWHNAVNNGAAALDPFQFPYNPSDPNEFIPELKYSFTTNYIKEDVNRTLIRLLEEGEEIVMFPAMNSSLTHLSSDYVWRNPAGTEPNTDCDGNINTIDQSWINVVHNFGQAIWRKPVPFSEDITNLCEEDAIINVEPFDNPNSYRFFAEFMSYYTGMFGTNTDIEDLSNYVPNNFPNDPNPDFTEVDLTPETNGLGWNQFMELWNEPTAHWTWPNNYGYYTPQDLAAMSHAVIGGNTGVQTTIGDNTNVNIGIHSVDSTMRIISPSPHEMDLNYYVDFIGELREYRAGFNFDVNNFHHYSAYTIADLQDLPFINRDTIVGSSLFHGTELNQNTKPYDLDLDGFPDLIENVELESAPFSPNAFWISPELDGYKERGNIIHQTLLNNNIQGDIWITEWGYTSQNGGGSYANYPEGLEPGETQARWLIRGFLEYNASPHINASFWHWLQDTGGGEWTQTTGILDSGGSRKTSWYYMHTMINEIGDKVLADEITLEGCTPDYVPSASIEQDDMGNQFLAGIDPIASDGNEINCPRIYKYGGECCPNEDIENYEESVWAIWFPYMMNKEGVIQVELGDLAIEGEPHSFYTVEPFNGLVDGYTSPLLAVNYPLVGDGFIEFPVSEKPIFLHFVGERVCGNDDFGINPGDNCSYGISMIGESDVTCTSISFEINIQSNCLVSAITNLIVTGSSGNNYDVFSSTNNITGNSATITINGLIPEESYDFTIGAEFQVGVEYGYITDVIRGLSTLSSDGCFTGMVLDGDATNIGYGFNCNSASIGININSAGGDVSSFQITSVLTQTDSDFNTVSSGTPLAPVLSFDWVEGSGNYTTTINMPSISPSSCYQLELNFTDVLGNTYGETEIVNFCADNCGESNPEAVTGIITNTCDEICFLPATFIDAMGNEQCVSQYRLEIRDQEGNYADIFTSIQDCDFDTPLCIDLNNLSAMDQAQIDMLGSPPYVAQIVSIFSGPATNGPQFDIGLCCDDTEFKPDLIVNKQCYNSNAYIYFCLDEIETCLNTSLSDIDIRVVGVENGYLNGADLNTTFEGWNGEDNCYSIHLRSYTKPVCKNISFTVLLNAIGTDGEPIEISFSHTLNYEGCCQVAEPAPEPPIRENMRVLTSVQKEDGSIFLSGKITEYRDILLESRKINHPIRYVLRDTKEQIIDYREYSDGINLLLPKGYETYRELNKNYSIHLLASNSIYEVLFPEDIDKGKSNLSESFNLEDIQIRESIELFPNPTNNEVSIFFSSKQDNSILSIYDMQGKRYLSKKINDMHTELNVSNFPNGVYFVEVIQLGGIIVREKLVIQ